MFSAAFAIVLIDSIIPAAEEQWGIQEAFSVFDHMLSRGMAPALVYQEHLIEMNEYRKSLRGRENPNYMGSGQRYPYQPNPVKDEQLGNNSKTLTPPDVPVNQMEQELIWSWMSMEGNDLGALHPDTMNSAIIGLNYDSMGASLDFDLDNQWLWGNYVPENGTG